MHLNRRTGLKLAALALGATALPRLLSAQGVTSSSRAIAVKGGQVVIHPVEHASMALETPGGVIYVDPVGGAAKYQGVPPADLILITHEHGDHFDQPTLDALPPVRLITNPSVHDKLPATMQDRASVMANSDRVEVLGLQIEAVPAHNTTPERMQYHPPGRDNGYILSIGGKRIYIAGDTEPTPEMLALKDIDVAFLPMNLPYTMTIEQAAEAVAAFRPGIVFPYHHRGSDVQAFATLVAASGAGTEVVLANWYPNGEG